MAQDKRYVYKSLLLTNSGFSSNFKIIEKRLQSSVRSFFHIFVIMWHLHFFEYTTILSGNS